MTGKAANSVSIRLRKNLLSHSFSATNYTTHVGTSFTACCYLIHLSNYRGFLYVHSLNMPLELAYVTSSSSSSLKIPSLESIKIAIKIQYESEPLSMQYSILQLTLLYILLILIKKNSLNLEHYQVQNA